MNPVALIVVLPNRARPRILPCSWPDKKRSTGPPTLFPTFLAYRGSYRRARDPLEPSLANDPLRVLFFIISGIIFFPTAIAAL